MIRIRAPLFLAWQLTNRCSARCLACCEESGPDKAWRDELTRDEALALTGEIVDAGIPYVAFGGGEPLSVPHAFEIFERLPRRASRIKLETDASRIDDAAADRIAALAMQCVQISVDGATAATHERVRPGSSFPDTVAAIERLVARGMAPQFVFVPTRLNVHEIVPAFDLAVVARMQRVRHRPDDAHRTRRRSPGTRLGLADDAWQRAADALRAHAQAAATRASTCRSIPGTSSPRWRRASTSPQAMLLVVPNGKVKLLNALPFAPADLRHDSLADGMGRVPRRVARARGARLRPALPRPSPRSCATPTRRGRVLTAIKG